jgi:hypothetical protein
MVPSIIRRPLPVTTHMPNAFAKAPRRSTSWIGFEQPDPRLYLKPPTRAAKKCTTALEESNTPQETSQTPQHIGILNNKNGSLPTHSIRNASPQCQAGATRVPSQVRNYVTLSTRKYTNFKSGLWCDQYLPTTRICIPWVPATWGPDDATFNVLDELAISSSTCTTKLCYDDAVEQKTNAEIKALEPRCRSSRRRDYFADHRDNSLPQHGSGGGNGGYTETVRDGNI